MSNPITATDLINEVRDLLDESNNTLISDTDILQALNRAQDDAVDMLVRIYPEPLIATTTTTSTSGTAAYDFPEALFEDRILKIECTEGTSTWELTRINYVDSTQYLVNYTTNRPYYYYLKGKEFVVLPTPGGSLTFTVWYVKEVEALVEPQGRIITVNTSSNYVLVDDLGSDLETVADSLKNYVNIVDSQTGEIKATMQITILTDSTNKIIFKSIPDRDLVYNKTIVGDIPSTVELDDYVCLAKGNCIPFLKKPMKNYIIISAVLDLKGSKLGEPVEVEVAKLDKLEKSIKSMWAGRENDLRIKKRSHVWPKYIRN